MSSERNWLFKINVEARDAQGNVDELIDLVQLLKREMATLNFRIPSGGQLSGFGPTSISSFNPTMSMASSSRSNQFTAQQLMMMANAGMIDVGQQPEFRTPSASAPRLSFFEENARKRATEEARAIFANERAASGFSPQGFVNKSGGFFPPGSLLSPDQTPYTPPKGQLGFATESNYVQSSLPGFKESQLKEIKEQNEIAREIEEAFRLYRERISKVAEVKSRIEAEAIRAGRKPDGAVGANYLQGVEFYDPTISSISEYPVGKIGGAASKSADAFNESRRANAITQELDNLRIERENLSIESVRSKIGSGGFFSDSRGLARIQKNAGLEPDELDKSGKILDALNNRFVRHIGLVVETVAVYKTMEMIINSIDQSIGINSQIESAGARASFIGGVSGAQGLQNANSIIQQGAAFGIAPSQQGDAVSRVTQATKNLGEQQKLAADAAKLAAVGNQNYGQSVDDLVRIQRAFNIPLSDTGRILDTIATIYKEVPSDIGEITNLLERLGPVAESTGLSMEQIGLIAARTSQQSGASISSTTSIFTRVQENLGNVSTQRTLAQFGINPLDARGELLPFMDIISQVKVKLDELKAAGRDTEAFDLTSAIAGKKPESIRIFLSMLDQINSKAPSISSINDLWIKQADTLDQKLKNLTTSWELLLKTAGRTDIVKGAIGNLTSYADAWSILLDPDLRDKFTKYMSVNGKPGVQVKQADIDSFMKTTRSQGAPSDFVDLEPWEKRTPDGATRTMTSSGLSTAGQNEFYFNILNATKLQALNKQSITEEQLNNIAQMSLTRANIEEKLWRDILTARGIIGQKQEEEIQALKDQLDGSAAEFNVMGKIRLLTGRQAAYAPDAYNNMSQNNQPGFLRANIPLGQSEQFYALEKFWTQKLMQAGINEEAKSTTIGFGDPSIQRLDLANIHLQAAQLALEQIEKNTRPKTTGIYNFPNGENPYVPLGAFELDRQTRSSSLLTDVSGIGVVIRDAIGTSSWPFVDPLTDSAKTQLTAAQLQLQAAMIKGGAPHTTRDDIMGGEGSTAKGYKYGYRPYKTRDDVTEGYYYDINQDYSFSPRNPNMPRSDQYKTRPSAPYNAGGIGGMNSMFVNLTNTQSIYIDGEMLRQIIENKVIEIMGVSTGGGSGASMFQS